jgi:hypothetical protein
MRLVSLRKPLPSPSICAFKNLRPRLRTLSPRGEELIRRLPENLVPDCAGFSFPLPLDVTFTATAQDFGRLSLRLEDPDPQYWFILRPLGCVYWCGTCSTPLRHDGSTGHAFVYLTRHFAPRPWRASIIALNLRAKFLERHV